MGVGPYPSAQGAKWGPEGRKIRVFSYMGAAMASFLCGFLFIYNGWGWVYQGLWPCCATPAITPAEHSAGVIAGVACLLYTSDAADE